jgi:peroxiredoxin Q/BCP
MRAWVEKKMYGKAYFGTERTTILVSNKNEIIKIWRKVKVNNHVEEVLDFIIKTRDIVT